MCLYFEVEDYVTFLDNRFNTLQYRLLVSVIHFKKQKNVSFNLKGHINSYGYQIY